MKTMHFNMWQIVGSSIDWLSVKFMGISIVLATITPSTILQVMSGIMVLSTIIYNGIRIYKELKKKTNDKN